MPDPTTKIGVFGGSFDPPHNGHLICAIAAAEKLGLGKILVIPNANQPLKPVGASAPAELRLAMVEAAFGSDPLFDIDRLELTRGGQSYTVDTLRELKSLYPASKNGLVLIVGADAFADIPRWKEPDAIFDLAEIAILARRGSTKPNLQNNWPVNIVELDTPIVDISSNQIRSMILNQEDISTLVPKPVLEIITLNNLYISNR